MDEGPILNPESGSQKRKGRPAGREKVKKARAALKGLDEWITKPLTSQEDLSRESDSPLYEYQAAKSSMMNVLAPETAMDGVNGFVLERLRMAQESTPMEARESNVNVGIPRIERAIDDGGWGILGLLESTGSGCRVDFLGTLGTDLAD